MKLCPLIHGLVSLLGLVLLLKVLLWTLMPPWSRKGGRSLNFKVQNEDLEAMSSKRITSMVIYTVGENPTIASIRRFIASNWNHVAQPEIFLHDE